MNPDPGGPKHTDTDPDSLEMLDPDPYSDPDLMNPDPQLCIDDGLEQGKEGKAEEDEGEVQGSGRGGTPAQNADPTGSFSPKLLYLFISQVCLQDCVNSLTRGDKGLPYLMTFVDLPKG
jgi:hypothetical protein